MSHGPMVDSNSDAYRIVLPAPSLAQDTHPAQAGILRTQLNNVSSPEHGGGVHRQTRREREMRPAMWDVRSPCNAILPKH